MTLRRGFVSATPELGAEFLVVVLLQERNRAVQTVKMADILQ